MTVRIHLHRNEASPLTFDSTCSKNLALFYVGGNKRVNKNIPSGVHDKCVVEIVECVFRQSYYLKCSRRLITALEASAARYKSRVCSRDRLPNDVTRIWRQSLADKRSHASKTNYFNKVHSVTVKSMPFSLRYNGD